MLANSDMLLHSLIPYSIGIGKPHERIVGESKDHNKNILDARK